MVLTTSSCSTSLFKVKPADRLSAMPADAPAVDVGVATFRAAPLLTDEETQELFEANLQLAGLLPVRLEITHNGGEPLEMLSSGVARRLTAVAVLSILEVEPACVSATTDRLSLALAAAERELCALASNAGRPLHDHADDAAERQTIGSRDVSGDRSGDEEDEGRLAASTQFGGVLFFLNVAAAVGLPALLENDPRLAGRGVRWTLHQLALLLGGDPFDAAVLAFAGLPPHQSPPSIQQPPADDAELFALHEHRRTLLHGVRERLGDRDDPDEALTRFVCARRASIVADPGWIEMHLPADEVSIEIRRGGLDRDPGWVPWLGVVVRFRYV